MRGKCSQIGDVPPEYGPAGFGGRDDDGIDG